MKRNMAKYFVMILLTACAEDYESNPLDINVLIKFDNPALEVFADGDSTVDISVTIDSDTEQEVTFTTDQGSFTGTGSSGSKTTKATTIVKKATVTLQADQLPKENVTVTASMKKGDKTYTNKTFVNFKTARPDMLYLTASRLTLPADQSTSATLGIVMTRGDGKSKISEGIKLNIEVVKMVAADEIQVDYLPFIKTKADQNTPLTFTVKSLNNKTGRTKVVVSTTNDKGSTVSADREILFQ
jgi:hypothetical protein